MRKSIFIFGIALCAMLVCSCESKKEATTPLTGDLVTFEKGGKYGVKNAEGVTLVSADYDAISYNDKVNVLEAMSGEETTLFGLDGGQLFSAKDFFTEPAGEGFFRMKAGEKTYLIGTGAIKGSWGPFADIQINGNYLFFKGEDGWGIATVDHKGLAPRKFASVYIVDNGKTFGVLVKDRDGWALYDKTGVTDGVQYDIAPKQLAKQVAKLKLPAEPYGVIKVDWKL
jgi:hypothetical protein